MNRLRNIIFNDEEEPVDIKIIKKEKMRKKKVKTTKIEPVI